VPLRPGEPPLPPDMLALAQKMEGLRVTSERFRLRTALTGSGSHASREEAAFLSLFDTDISGEATLSPPAGTFTLSLLGHTIKVRIVHGTVYLYEPTLARHDGGRPWVDLGHRGLGGPLTPSLPLSSLASTFQGLARTLEIALSATELGPGVIDGLPITGFRATVATSALEEPAVPAKPHGILEGIFGRAAAAPVRSAPNSAVVEVFIAPSGLPVRTHVSVSSEGVSVSAQLDVFAINFALRVQAPPRRQTIAAAALRKLSESGAHRRTAERGEDESE
jgi:hypothetical protein